MKNTILTAIFILTVLFTVNAQNPIITDMFTADPAPLVYNDTVYLYSGHDGATEEDTNYKMPDWYVFSSTDMVNWKNHGACLSPEIFSWATGEAYAAHTTYRNGKFYWYVSTFHKSDEHSKGGAAIGVAVSDSPTGPFVDALGKALIVNEMTTEMKHGWDDIDPAVFIDDNEQAYLYWGNGDCKWVKLKENMIEVDSSITTFKPKNYIEGPWIYKRNGLYYLIYAGAGTKPEMIEYSTSNSPEGPWEYRGIIAENAPNSFTIHPGIIDFKGETYFFYHNGLLPTGGSYRRSICIDYLYFNKDGTIKKVIQTTEGVKPIETKTKLAELQWEYLIDENLTKWDVFMGIPHYSVDIDGYEKGDGMHGTPIGLNKDPLNVFSVKEIDGEEVLYITGEIYGGLSTKSEFENYYFSAEFKWGEKQWEPRLKDKKDSGILYHSQEPHGQFWNVWMRAPEMQVQVGDTGDFHPLAGVSMDIKARKIEEGEENHWVYDPNGEYRTFKSNNHGRCRKSVNYENLIDQWNLLELICIGDKAYHIVNGKVVMVLENSVQYDENDNPSPLTKGKIQIQSEAAEIYYKNIKISNIETLPEVFASQIK